MGHISDLFWKEYLMHFPYYAHHTSIGSVSNSSYTFFLLLFFFQGKLDRAIEIFTTLLQYKSDLPAAHLGTGLILHLNLPFLIIQTQLSIALYFYDYHFLLKPFLLNFYSHVLLHFFYIYLP